MEKNVLVEMNCLGDICPVPIMKLIKIEKELSEGMKVMLVTDHSCTSESVKNYCVRQNYQFEVVEPVNGVWEIYISR